jgi:amino acid transporter
MSAGPSITDQSVLDDTRALHQMGYAQELARGMKAFSNFAISFSMICILAGGVTSFQTGFSTLGGFGIGVGWLVGGAFSLIVGLAMAQIGSTYPTAGGLYHWSSILGGRGWGWATAWMNLLGLIFVTAAVTVGAYTLFISLILTNIFHIDTSNWGYWQQLAGVIVIAISQGLLNHFGIKLTSKLTDFSGYLIFFVAILLTATMLFSAPRLDLSRLFHIVNNTGDPGGGVVPSTNNLLYAFLLGLLLPLYTITGFDASAHTAEETLNARVAVPKGIINSILYSLLFGYVMICSFVLAMSDPIAAAKDGANVFFNLLAGLPVADPLKDALYILLVIANYLCALACITSTSRMVFAFSRDGGVPYLSPLLRKVSPTFRTPVGGIWATVILAIAATLYSSAYNALAAGSAVFLYISYAMPIAAGLYAESKGWRPSGPFKLGAWSKPIAVVACLGVVGVTWIGLQPPNDIVINYAVGILALLVVGWFALERKRFPGPPISATDIAERHDEILAEEAAVGETIPAAVSG